MNALVLVFSFLSLLVPAEFWGVSGMHAAMAPPDPSLIEGANNYLKAVLAGDVPAIVAMYREDGVVMAPGHGPLRGRASIEAFYREMCLGPAKITAFTFDHLDSTVAGDTAYDVGTYGMTIAVGPGKSINDTGKYSVILKRAGSEWKIAYLIFNSDLPQNGPAAQRH
jgi:uncharacterized protein (TIGR02246 family)